MSRARPPKRPPTPAPHLPLEALTLTPLGATPPADSTPQLAPPHVLRHDFYVLLTYLRATPVKRTHRENLIPKPHAAKLLKRFAFRGAPTALDVAGFSTWAEFLDELAVTLGLISYDQEGTYAGYSSREPSFPDNWIKLDQAAIATYLNLDGPTQDRRLADGLIKRLPSEFFTRSPLFPQHERFSSFGSGYSLASRMDLPALRSQLLSLLAALTPGEWFAFDDLVDWLEAEAPFLILPDEKIEVRDASTRKVAAHRYACFNETKPADRFGSGVNIPDRAADAYARVEGRYLAYFLETLPQLLGVVDLAFGEPLAPASGLSQPPRGYIRALRVSPRLRGFWLPAEAPWETTRATLLPTYEIVLESPGYVERALERLAPYTEVVGEEGPLTRLKLVKKKTLEAFAAGHTLDELRATLAAAGVAEVPSNVAFELTQWAGKAEQIVLHRDVLVVECATPASATGVAGLKALAPALIATVGEDLALYRDPTASLRRLEEAGLLPESRPCPERPFVSPTAPAQTRSRLAGPVAPPLRPLQLTSRHYVSLFCPDTAVTQAMCSLLDGAQRIYYSAGSVGPLFMSEVDRDWLLVALAEAAPGLGVKLTGP